MTPRGKYKGHELHDLLPRVRWVSCNFTRVMISTSWQQLDLEARGLLTTLLLHQAAYWTVPSTAVEISHVVNLREWTPERVEMLLPCVKKFFKPAGRKAMYHADTRAALMTAMDQLIGSKNGGAKSGEVRGGKQGEFPLDNAAAGSRAKGGSNTEHTRQRGENKKQNTTKRAGAQGEKAESRVYEQTTLELTTADLLLLKSFPGAPGLYSEEVPKVLGKARVIAFNDAAWRSARIADVDGRKTSRRQLRGLVCANDEALKKLHAA